MMGVFCIPPQNIFSIFKEVIHFVTFNHYGRRMAICSSDELVKVWDKLEGKDDWKKSAEWKAHSDPVRKITWVHPEFGQAIATCSGDRAVAVWEEQAESYIKGKNWIRKANLLESKTAVIDIKFSSNYLGLLLATCSSDGAIRIYKAANVLDLSQWILHQEVYFRHEVSCLSWNPNYRTESFSTKCLKLSNDNIKKDNFNNIYSNQPFLDNDSNSYIVIPQGGMLAVGFKNGNCKAIDRIAILQYVPRLSRWNKTDYSLHGDNHCTLSVPDPVHDLSFAVRLGRSFDLLAVAGRDIKIYAFYQLLNSSMSAFKFKLYLMDSFPGHYTSVWKINWNSVGNALITSGNDGCIKLWKQHHTFSEIKGSKDVSSTATIYSKAENCQNECCWKSTVVVKPTIT